MLLEKDMNYCIRRVARNGTNSWLELDIHGEAWTPYQAEATALTLVEARLYMRALHDEEDTLYLEEMGSA
jgi:hypothetical protein